MTTALTRARVCMAGVHLCTAMFLGGCALTGPDFDTPEVVVPDEWNADPTPGFTSQTPEYNRWWEVFDDPVLNTLVQTAYEQNLTLQVPSEVLSAWQLEDGRYRLVDQLDETTEAELVVSEGEGKIQLALAPVNGYILQLQR